MYGPYQEIIEVIGTDNFIRLSEKIGGRFFHWPQLYSIHMIPRNEIVLSLAQSGKKHREIAEIVGLSRSGISTILMRQKRASQKVFSSNKNE